MRTFIARTLPVCLTGSLLLALLPLAGATHVAVEDAADTRGPVDISRVRVVGRSEPRWIISTFGRFTAEATRDSVYLLVQLDTFGTGRYDYYGLIRSNGRRFLGSLWRDRRNRDDLRLRTLRVSRPSAASIRLRIPFRSLNRGDRIVYRWRVISLFIGGGCRRVCIDRAPDQEGVPEPFPGEDPSPTPSFTLVPTGPASPEPSPTPSLVPSP